MKKLFRGTLQSSLPGLFEIENSEIGFRSRRWKIFSNLKIKWRERVQTQQHQTITISEIAVRNQSPIQMLPTA